MFLKLPFYLIASAMMVFSQFLYAQISPSWVNQVQSYPSAVFDQSLQYQKIVQVGDVLYSDNRVFSCGHFAGAKGQFGSITVYSDTSKLSNQGIPSAVDFITGFIASTDNNGNYLWVKPISSNDIAGNGMFPSPLDVNMPYRMCKGTSGEIYVTGAINGDSVTYDGQLIYTHGQGFKPTGYLLKISPTGQLLWSRFWFPEPDFSLPNSSHIPVALFITNGKIHVQTFTPGINYAGNFIPFGPSVVRIGTIRFLPDGTFEEQVLCRHP